MKKRILSKLFIRLSKIIGYEVIDQNNFVSPTLNKELNEDLSLINQKSIVLPLGEVEITRKVKSILIFAPSSSAINSIFPLWSFIILLTYLWDIALS